ncbi:hypothetical protein BD309DRAFT_962536 [Dichomitus squalens]|nr:hypothetical protein BD309DRAFT_962536 [Dichomitus squalens]
MVNLCSISAPSSVSIWRKVPPLQRTIHDDLFSSVAVCRVWTRGICSSLRYRVWGCSPSIFNLSLVIALTSFETLTAHGGMFGLQHRKRSWLEDRFHPSFEVGKCRLSGSWRTANGSIVRQLASGYACGRPSIPVNYVVCERRRTRTTCSGRA